MNTEVILICDRCGETIDGIIIQDAGMPKLTGGFYDVSEGCWHEYARGDYEQNVCDRCMWEDPKFIEKYPVNRKIPQ